MSHPYMMETESLHPDSAPMTPLPTQPSPAAALTPSTTNTAAIPMHPVPVQRTKPTKAHVPSACINCKKAHLACDLTRPCKRCISVGKDDTCRDVEHKKRGRPKLVDKAVALDGGWAASAKDGASAALAKAAAALAKTRVKGKYTKSANYKMPKKSTVAVASCPSIPSTEAYAAPQTNTHSRDIAMDTNHARPSSYPTHHEQDIPLPVSYRAHPTGQGYQSRPLSMHSEPPLPGDHQDPFHYPPSLHPSTSQIKRPQEMYSAPSSAPLATVFLTMDLICARVSDESQVLWGYHPHDISNKSLYSIIATEDHGKMRSLLGLIRDAVFAAAPSHPSQFSFLDSTSPVFYQNRPGIMSSSAPGSSEYTDVVRVCHADGGSDLFSIRLYIGGGLGTDLLRGLSMEHAYVVCIMARHVAPTMSDPSRSNGRLSLDEPRTLSYNNRQPSQQQRYSPMEPANLESSRKISLPPILTGPSSNAPSLSSPSPLSSGSSNGRHPMPFGSSASGMAPLSSSPSSSSSSSYSVPLSKPSSHSSSLPSLRTGPLHQARWLYDSEPFGGPGYASQNAANQRLPTVFSDPFRALSAPMGGFGVSKYLNRQESAPSFNNIRRHQLPLPSPSSLQSPQGSRLDSANRAPRTLQRDLSSSSFGASFASRSPPLSMKRPLADMADSQDRNRDIDNRHQDHYQHQSLRPSGPAPSSSSSLPSSLAASSRSAYQQSIKLELQTMPPDHPAIDPSSAGVCPIVHGSQQRERIQQQVQLQAGQLDRERGQEYDREHERETETIVSKGYFEQERSSPGRHHSLSPGGGGERGAAGQGYHGDSSVVRHFSPQCEDRSDGGHGQQRHGNNSVNPFSTGASSPTEPYPHHRGGNALRRTSSVGRSSYISRSRGAVVCLSGACGSVCRCSGEDEETRAVKAMDAARKRMSVHSLLC